MPREDNSTVSTGKISLRVRPGVDTYAIAQRIATECRIPEAPLARPYISGIQNPELAATYERESRDVTFPLVWQRVGDDVETMRYRITQLLFSFGPDVIEQIHEISIMTERDVAEREATHSGNETVHRTPPVQLHVA